jgi:DNA-binding GntR family transcriptional regulator
LSAPGARAGKNSRGTPHEPLANAVADHLRSQILSGALRPGERIRQEAIARAMGTSRIPVREALSRLQNEGLVTLTSHVGARVAELDSAELDEIYRIRERLEPLALAQSTPRLTDAQLDGLVDYVEEMEACADVEDPSSWVDLDRRFHLATYAGARMPRLIDMIEGLWNATQQYRRAYTRLPERFAMAHQEHRLILEALHRRDALNAEMLSLLHIRRTRLTLDEHAELFSGPDSSLLR